MKSSADRYELIKQKGRFLHFLAKKTKLRLSESGGAEVKAFCKRTKGDYKV